MMPPVEGGFLEAAPTITAGNLLWLFAGLLFIGMHFAAEPLRWRLLFPGATTTHVWLSLFNFTAFVSYALPFKLGIPFRLLLLNRYASLTPSQIAIGMISDSLCYYSLWALCGSLGFIVTAQQLPRTEMSSLFWLALVVLGCVGLTLLAQKVTARLPVSAWRKYAVAAFGIIRWSKLPTLMSIVLLDILSHILRHIALVKLFNLDIGYFDIAALAVAAILAGLLSFTPMGLGGYDAVLVAGLIQYGAPVQTAVWLTLSNRVLTLLVAVVLGIRGAFVLRINPFDLSGLRSMVAARTTRRQQ
jgi:uncharacterized membrane protein YbhN (UPF0104 family)